jgi:hypothetical protein
MRDIVAAAASKVAAAYGMDPQDVGRACSNRPDGRGFVSDAVASRTEGRVDASA